MTISPQEERGLTIRRQHTTMAGKGPGRFFCGWAVLITVLWGIAGGNAFAADDIPAGKIINVSGSEAVRGERGLVSTADPMNRPIRETINETISETVNEMVEKIFDAHPWRNLS